jgi:hypothetical protein
MQFSSPPDQLFAIRITPEMRDQRSHQQLLDKAHAGVGRHLERAQLEQPKPPSGRLRGIELVDAELGSMRVAGQIGKQMPEDAIDQPWRYGWRAFVRNLFERDR